MCSNDSEHVSRLENEYTISRQLALQCTSVRLALSMSEFDGFPAIYLEWAAGITLSEWINLLHKELRLSPLHDNSHYTIMRECDMRILLTLACTISKALAGIHCAGATHNNLTPSNIVVEDIDGSSNKSVKLIGLGSASFLTDSLKTNSKIHEDLLSLGA
eukprot:7433986-Ditylum_brightwellii.AAC.1